MLQMKRARIEVVEGADIGKALSIEAEGRFSVGRVPDATLHVANDPLFSRHQFFVELRMGKLMLLDLRSTNGTFVNNIKTRAAFLQDGDVIFAGQTRLRVFVAPSATSSSSADGGGTLN
jgi:pSer/pThr/pTyr-binding forkhead associated (FHA) protein